MNKKHEALNVLENTIEELESNKGSVSVAVQKLSRASDLLDEKFIYSWTQIQLANNVYISPLQDLYSSVLSEQEENGRVNLQDEKYKKHLENMNKLNIDLSDIQNSIRFKVIESSGGYQSVDFIEKKLLTLNKEKTGNDRVYYRNNLQEHLTYIKQKTYAYTTKLIKKLKFEGTVESSFDILKNAVDDKLLEINPELAEQLMIAFKATSSENKEELSQGLTTCRRLIEKLADHLYPATDESIDGRTFKQNQYINRIWRFMDISIQSRSNKDMAKAHIDYLGSWLQKDYSLTCKGVHSNVSRIEATKTVFHIYLLLADLLEYLDQSQTTKHMLSINDASMDEIEALLGVSRKVAKEIIKARVKFGSLSEKQFRDISGIGKKTVEVAKDNFTFK